MLCPICSVDLVMSERNGVEIDYCPKCRGVWLDRGELDKIIERSTPQRQREVQNSQPNYQQNLRRSDSHYNDGYYKKKKGESWLGEIFDF
ncbi:zf-TFIIB domain-containing protein [Helicobacter ganmani]|uniref:TFIIB-type zinc ribbon-containing protein n=1 Tax=Helicobacter ganmani TaxID=60246 RepID=UPI003A86F90D